MRYIALIILGLGVVQLGCATSPRVSSQPNVNLTGSLELFEEELADYNSQTGLGCSVTPEPGSEDLHVLCRSKRSPEKAWDAVTAKSKELCPSDKWKMLFERKPSLPKEGNVYRSQMDIRCI